MATFNVKTVNKISADGLAQLDKAKYAVADDAKNPDGILVRSANLHEYEFEDNLSCIVRAGAGTNNIPIDKCSEKGIVVFNTPGANANAVKELVLCSLILASRDIIGGIDWAKTLKGKGADVATLVEKGKGSFVGPEVYKKTLGVVGLGAIGALVANIGISLGMNVIGYDPFMSVDSAWKLDRHVTNARDLKSLFEQADYISLHAPYTPDTKGYVNAEAFSQMKDGVRIVNIARGELVNDADMIAALESGKVARYVTDFPNDNVLDVKNIVAIPHLGASTPESEENCAFMAVDQLSEFLEYGNIRNSVNFPNVEAAREGVERICVIHKNIPNTISPISSAFASEGINISNLVNKSKKDMAYTVLDIDAPASEKAIAAINAVEGVLKVRVIK